jgi:hypothetical protein
VKRLSGKNDLPLLVVGTLVQIGFQEELFNGLLNSAGYPSSVPRAPIEALRKMDSAAPAPATAQARSRQGAGGDADPAADATTR